VRGRKRGKLKSSELDPTNRTKVVAESDFQTLTYISAEL